MANNFSNDSLFSTTETGSALSFSVDSIPNIASPTITLGSIVTQYGDAVWQTPDLKTGSHRDGLALSDFNDPDIAIIALPFDYNLLSNGTLLGAFGQSLGAAFGVSSEDWYPSTSYTVGQKANYYDGENVAIYTCLANVTSATPPPNDTVSWEFYSYAFYLRLVPSANPLQPGLQQNDSFYHYVKVYPIYIQSGYPYSVWLAGKSYTDSVGTYGRQNAITNDTSPNTNVTLGLAGVVSGTVSGKTITATYSDTTFNRFVLDSKVRIRGGSGITIPFAGKITAVSTTGFTATITTTGTWSNTTQYGFYDFVEYTPPAGSLGVYIPTRVGGSAPPKGSTSGITPANTTYWTKITGSFTSGSVDPIISAWNLYLDTDFFEQELIPVPAGTTSYSNVRAQKEINSYAYNDQIINQKQTLFTSGDYIIYEGFPFDKDSITGGSMNITASILPAAISAISRPPVSTTSTEFLPQSDNRWIPASLTGSFDYPANANYNWASNNGATARNLTVFNDTNHTYVPDLLNGNAASNPSANANLLKLATPDASIPPLTAISSVAFKTNDLMFQSSYNPYKIDGSNANDFSTFMVLYLDYVPSAVMNSQIAADQTNWYGIMSQAKQTNVLATDIANWKSYTQIAPRLSVRYKLDGTISLNLGDTTLTAIRSRSGINRPFQPIIVGLTINAADTSATLTVVDTEVHRSTVTYTKNWGSATPEVPNAMLYGAVPYANYLRSSKMYVLEINHYYSTHDNAFFDNEIKTMDKMYAVTSGRVS